MPTRLTGRLLVRWWSWKVLLAAERLARSAISVPATKWNQIGGLGLS
jgi:hypothetical protein